MKLAVLKLGARIVFGDKIGTSGGSGEAQSIINMLLEAGNEVHCFTKVLDKDVRPANVKLHHIENDEFISDDYGALIVINGSVNFFGGAEDKSQILNYSIINKFDKEVFYMFCDPNLPLKQIWPSIEKKEWSSNWKKDDLLITKPINIISQSTNIDKVKAAFKDVQIKTVNTYPFQMFPMMFEKPVESLEGRTVDIMYGGTFRAGRREKKLIQFYFGHPDNMEVEVFGKIKLSDFNTKKINGLSQPKFTGAVNYDKMLSKMSKSKAHIAIGDGHYPEFGMISQRIYESIMSGCVTFIDLDLDPEKKVFGKNSDLDFLYVTDRNQVSDRFNSLSENELNTISQRQLEIINFDSTSYCLGLSNMIKDNL